MMFRRFQATKKLANAAIARLTLNCSDSLHPIIAAKLVFLEDYETADAPSDDARDPPPADPAS